MHAAARIKPNREAVYDEPRIEDVVSKVLVEAKIQGLSPNIAEPVWRKLIERCIAHEFVKRGLRAPKSVGGLTNVQSHGDLRVISQSFVSKSAHIEIYVFKPKR